MLLTQNETLADISFTLKWHKSGVTYQDTYFAHGVNFWQDYFPERIRQEIMDKPEGYQATIRFSPGEMIPAYDDFLVRNIKLSQLDMSRIRANGSGPAQGRFYPKGIISDIAGIYRQNVTPFRFIKRNGRTAQVDFNHPLAGMELELDIEICHVEKNDRKCGGSSVDWFDLLTTGPGMQTGLRDIKTEFFDALSFSREDVQPDDIFYQKERMVSHIDEAAQQVLQDIYGKFLKNEDVVLDLMASWQSHLPDGLNLKHLDGLGLNKKELAANQLLDDYEIHDLNDKPMLPYENDRFDAVICSLSVEYLTTPFDVFRDVARVLKSGGSFIVSFSNRWFPPKAIEVWKHLHEYERMALVKAYLSSDGRFENIRILSERGYPRPYTDKYFPAKKDADPIYVVIGTRI